MSPRKSIAIKICGITQISQAHAIAEIGVDAIGIIGVKESPRYINKEQRQRLFNYLQEFFPTLKRVWVIANSSDKEIDEAIHADGNPTTIQLHGFETRERCLFLKEKYPKIEWWKAFRIRSLLDIEEAMLYEGYIDNFLFDAWDSKELGGTGIRIPLNLINRIKINSPWWLAGGISAECINEILEISTPKGIDASSKLELSPGIKDLKLVALLVKKIKEKNI